MNYQLQYLAHLVLIKNELNRKRRRFWAMSYIPWSKKTPHASFPRAYAFEMYREAQREMRAMTKEMREVQKLAGARMVWGGSGNIRYIRSNGVRWSMREIERLADLYKADGIILGES